MIDWDTFLTTLYVRVDDFCKTHLPAERRPGPDAALTRSEVVTLAICAQWGLFGSERQFYRYAQRAWRGAFPRLPDRSQFNRLMRRHWQAIAAFALHQATGLGAGESSYEVLDTSGVRVRDSKRRGAGWLYGYADIGWCSRLGWYEGFHLLIAVTPQGAITGFGLAPASAKDQPMTEAFLALRHQPDERLPSVGAPAQGPYVADTGFEGQANHQRWEQRYGATVICPPQPRSRRAWPKPWRRWLSGLRQIVETVYEKLHHAFRLDRERPHDLFGLQARLAAKVALHNFCMALNEQLQRPRLAFAELIDW